MSGSKEGMSGSISEMHGNSDPFSYFWDKGFTIRRRNSAEKSSTSRSSSVRSIASSSSTLAGMDNLLISGGEKRSGHDGHGEETEDSDLEQERHAGGGAAEPQSDAAPRKARKSKRPCKSKRKRYSNLVTRLEQKIESDPDFHVSQAKLPPSLVANDKLHSKLMARLTRHAELLRDGADAATASAASHRDPPLVAAAAPLALAASAGVVKLSL
mmetsp:Transcript_78868/g.231473  ORF Transcript_78868/g.231473 Transcript_78868/m.231473 type:complete len:213 (+) Transcript_78868:49-687(+)